MKKRNYILILSIIIILLIAYIAGFRIVYNPELENDWEAISAIGTWVEVFATIAIAISLQMQSSSISPIVRFINFSNVEDIPYLVITNTGEKPLIISQISFNLRQYSLGRINAEDYLDIGSVTTEHFIIKPFEVKKIELPIALFQSQISEFHNGDNETWNNFCKEIENEVLVISFQDITGKRYYEKTTLSSKQYLDIVMKS